MNLILCLYFCVLSYQGKLKSNNNFMNLTNLNPPSVKTASVIEKATKIIRQLFNSTTQSLPNFFLKNKENINNAIQKNQTKPQVTLKIFGEPLCPSCQRLIIQLRKIQNLLTYINLETYFYGFAYESDNKEFHCHHGEEECQLSAYLNCASQMKQEFNQTSESFINQNQVIDYFICMENNYQNITIRNDLCIKYLNGSIMDQCLKNTYNVMKTAQKQTQLILNKTQSLPYVELNGEYIDILSLADTSKFKQILCDKLIGISECHIKDEKLQNNTTSVNELILQYYH